jgi:acyl-coenzyme A synthetase/AMP-(fatty) acid ligase
MLFHIDDPGRRNRIAIIDAAAKISWTYGRLNEEVQRRRDFLVANRGLVFHFCNNDLSSVTWYLACLDGGVPIALLNGQLNAVLRSDLISLYRPKFVIAEEKPGDYEATVHDGLSQWVAPVETPLHPKLALLLSTSGSTGSPKLVRLTPENITANASSIQQALAIEENHFPVAHLPLHYSYGLSVLNSHLLAGAKVLLTRSGLMNAGFWSAIRENQVNSFSGVPYTYQMLKRLDLEKLNVPSLLTFTQAGGKLDREQVSYFHERVARRGGTFWVMYGQTEATARMTILPAFELPRKLGSAGKAIPGGRLAIKTDDGEIAAGAVGELIYHGPNVMMGYAQTREDLSRGDALQGYLETGDRASLDDEGFVTILGRSKRDAKLFGLRVNLDELEAFVKEHGPAAAISAENGVVIFCEFGNDQYLRKVCIELATRLRIHSSAFHFRRIDQLPLNASGKIDYELLRKSL